MHRSALTLRTLGTLVGIIGAASLAVIGEQQAAACGGCFQPPPPPNQTTSDITDERMLLATSQTQTTLYDQIQYSGNPASFAWVLPIHGTVNVGLSADVLFDSVDALTATDVVAPPPSCPAAPNCQAKGGGFANSSAGPAAPGVGSGMGEGTVTVTKQQNVGPYATVQLSSTSPTALEDWLTQNSFDIPAAVKPVIAQYVTEGFNFLAMKLLPGQGVQAMRPVRVTSPGAGLSLPLRMAAIGTGATVGITIWVVADGRYEPQNFPFFHIDDSEIVWDWSSSSSNYTTLRTQHEATYNGKGWELESSVTLAQQTVTGVVQSGGVYYGSPGGQGGPGGGPGPGGGIPGPVDASQDYLPITAANGTVTETAEQVRTDDVTALFAGIAGPNARVTRMRSDISHAAMTVDFTLQASADQSESSNVRNVTKSINEQCPIYGNDCSVIGYGTPGQAAAAAGGGTGSAGNSTFACNASPEPLGGPVGLGAGAALLGLVVVRLRRRRS
jgi:hypothetical protein